MAINIINSANSFVRFGDPVPSHCIWGDINFCLPIYEAGDFWFQFIVNMDTAGEVECLPGAAEIQVALAYECGQPLNENSVKPTRYKLSDTQILYSWQSNFPGFELIQVGECFKIQVTILSGEVENTFCSNCFERIADPCFTSILEYSNEEDAFGFKYCAGGGVEEEPVTCEPTYITFTNQAIVTIPYTAPLQAKYGNMPNVQVWLYDPSGVLTNMGVQVTFDSFPPTVITVDNGGPGSGVIILR